MSDDIEVTQGVRYRYRVTFDGAVDRPKREAKAMRALASDIVADPLGFLEVAHTWSLVPLEVGVEVEVDPEWTT